MDTESSGTDSGTAGLGRYDDFSDLLDMCTRITHGYHTLAEESILTEEKFLEFVQHIETDVRHSWNTSEFESRRLQMEMQTTENEHSKASGTMKYLRKQLQGEMDRRVVSENRVKELQSILNTLRDMLSGDRTLTDEERQRMYESTEEFRQNDTSSSTRADYRKSEDLDADRMSFDRSDDEALLEEDDEFETAQSEPTERISHTQTQTRRQTINRTSHGETTKFVRVEETTEGDIEIIAKTHVRIPENGPVSAHTRLSARPRKSVGFTEPVMSTVNVRRSRSVPRFVEDTEGNRIRRSKEEAVIRSSDSESQFSEASLVAGDYGPQETGPSSSNSNLTRRRSKSLGKGLDLRPHNFVETFIIVPNKCVTCNGRVNIGHARKCRYCGHVCHNKCEAGAPIPCAPHVNNPIGDKSGGQIWELEKLVPDRRPRFPAVVAQCVSFIQKYGIAEEGLYRVSGSVARVSELKKAYYTAYKRSPQSAVIPGLVTKDGRNARIEDVHVVCGFLKNFLLSLKEPLITHALYQRFVEASSVAGNTEIYGLINKLPIPNRDTLAYLMMHFRRIADTPAVRMSTENLEKVLAVSLIGYSAPVDTMSQMKLQAEFMRQQMIIHKLFQINRNFWEELQTSEPKGRYSGDCAASNRLNASIVDEYDAPNDSMVMEGGAGLRGVGNTSFSKMASNFFKTGSSSKTTTTTTTDSSKTATLGRGPLKFQSPLMSD